MSGSRREFQGRKVRVAVRVVVATCVAMVVSATSLSCHRIESAVDRVEVAVLVVTMFDGEAASWLRNEQLDRTLTVPTIDAPMHCDTEGLCVATIGQGKANAAANLSAILVEEQLDLTSAYFMTAGIAGVNPKIGTLGDAAWADWVVDYEMGGHHISDDTDPTVPFGYQKGQDQGTTVYRLNQQLVSMAYELTKDLPLANSADAEAARAHYAGQAGRTPQVSRCDTVTADDFWTGSDASETAEYIVDQWTNNDGTYCTSQQEDNATAAVLARHGYLSRYLSLRTASDFDQPYAGQSARQVLTTFPGSGIAFANAYTVGSSVAHYLMSRTPPP
jgi:purine nucleoside permease